MVVVDTNIIVPLYVRSASTDAVKELRGREKIWRTDPFALIEFSNVLITYERARYLTAGKARECLGNAESFLRPHYFSVTNEAALDLAIRYGITGYDGRFLALAQQLGRPLVTEDAKLRAAAPTLTQLIEDALARA